LADESLKELLHRVSVRDVVLFKDLVGEFGACFECKALREDEGVIAVEKDVFDLFLAFWQSL
jgi:hypothetical protein